MLSTVATFVFDDFAMAQNRSQQYNYGLQAWIASAARSCTCHKHEGTAFEQELLITRESTLPDERVNDTKDLELFVSQKAMCILQVH